MAHAEREGEPDERRHAETQRQQAGDRGRVGRNEMTLSVAIGSSTSDAIAVSQKMKAGGDTRGVSRRATIMRSAKLKPAASPTASAAPLTSTPAERSVATSATPAAPAASAGHVARPVGTPVSRGARSAMKRGPV